MDIISILDNIKKKNRSNLYVFCNYSSVLDQAKVTFLSKLFFKSSNLRELYDSGFNAYEDIIFNYSSTEEDILNLLNLINKTKQHSSVLIFGLSLSKKTATLLSENRSLSPNLYNVSISDITEEDEYELDFIFDLGLENLIYGYGTPIEAIDSFLYRDYIDYYAEEYIWSILDNPSKEDIKTHTDKVEALVNHFSRIQDIDKAVELALDTSTNLLDVTNFLGAD